MNTTKSRVVRSKRRFLPCVFFLIVFLLFNFVIAFRLWSKAKETLPIIISLTSSSRRLTRELPLALKSLIQQTIPPAEIRVYIPEEDIDRLEKAKDDPNWGRWLKHPLVKLHFVEDRGPGSKFLFVIEEYLNKMAEEKEVQARESIGRQPILVCDDDHWYPPDLVEAFLDSHRIFPDAALGRRGWRVRKDLRWGVPSHESKWHVLYSLHLAEPYRVGVITANHGYLVQPRFFDTGILNHSSAPEAARWMDDIWMNGWLARAKVPRLLTPSRGFAFEIFHAQSLIEEKQYEQNKAMSRQMANNRVLAHFADAWENDLWYQLYGVNAPTFKGWLRMTFVWPSVGVAWLRMQWNVLLLAHFPLAI